MLDTVPAFFQPDHTYTRQHHGDTIRFLVRHVSEAPDGSYRVAFGWRLDDDGDWEPSEADDLDGWTDITSDAPADPADGPAAVVDVSRVLSDAADAIAMDRDYQLPEDGPLKPGMDRAEKLLRRMAEKLAEAGL